MPCKSRTPAILVQDAREELEAARGASDILATPAPQASVIAPATDGVKPEGALEVKAEEKEVNYCASIMSN